ncbi:MAG: tyrosine-type recombinase/integrase [Rhizobiaceae bacterium]
MEAKLVGVHSVKAKLASGDEVVYHYAWRGGPRIKAKPGTNAFTQEFARLTRDRPVEAKSESVGWLISEYLESGDYQKLAPSTRRDYERIIGVIRTRFGGMPLLAVGAKGARNTILKWRDSMKSTPRAADLTVAVLARILSWGKSREHITANPLERVEKLHSGSRKDIIWMPGQLETFLSDGSRHLGDVVKVALWTMQRQGDILAMPTLAYDDGRLWITQGKTGARVRIRAPEELVPLLEQAKAEKRQRVLVNSYGQNWTSSGFRASLRREMARLKIKGVTFHDLRGTGITYAYANGADIERIAEISGHSKSECETIIRKNYLAGGDVIEAIRAGTKRA